MFWLGATRAEIPRALLFSAEPSPRTGPYAVIHAVAAKPEKTWPADRFLAVAEQLGLDTVFIGGPGDDLGAFSARFPTLTGMPLEQTKALLRDASLFVGNDSGPAHMAAAFGVPAAVLFGPSDVTVWSPWRTESQVLQATPITGISVAAALNAVARLRQEVAP
jgi:ADP-heptose:LPS heptosyltransferase